ncbi:MAG: Nramp family divalent metal transporter [Leadbetterella sp.]
MTWKNKIETLSLPEVNGSIPTHSSGSFWWRFRAYIGPGFLVAVGYMDPGNWATDIAGGSQFGYTLLSVILVSSIFAIILQHLALKLGVATGKDLAQACKASYGKATSIFLWILAEIAIAATDLAEVIGSAIALKLLFNIPLLWGILITAIDVMLILFLQKKSFRYLEIIVATLTLTIILCFGYELVVSNPDLKSIANGLIPTQEIILDSNKLLIAIGILGATVMPHNLYLHSSIIQTRNFKKDKEGIKEAIWLGTIDSTLSLSMAFFVNAAILILSAAAFHSNGHQQVADIHDAYKLLDPVLGVKYAGILFAVALLASGQNASLTGTLSGQIVMEGFLNIRLKPWIRRLLTRLIAIVPAFFVCWYAGESATGKLLVLSQVILSLQLSFAVLPLVIFTSDRSKMGEFVNSLGLKICVWAISLVIIALNMYMLVSQLF